MYYSGNTYYKAGTGPVSVDLSKQNSGDYGGFELQDDWSSCAYFYLDSPVDNLPPIDPVEKRIEGLLK